MYTDIHGKISEVVKETHRLKTTEFMRRKEVEKSGKLESEEIHKKLKMINQEIENVNEELSKAWQEMDLDRLKEEEADEARRFRQEEIKLKLKITQQVLKNVDQELQEILLSFLNQKVLDRVLLLSEESLQLLQKGESIPTEKLQEEVQKVHQELHDEVRKYSTWSYILELGKKLQDFYKIITKLQENMMALCGIDELHHIIKQKLLLIDGLQYDAQDMLREAHNLIIHVQYLITEKHFMVNKVARSHSIIIIMYLYHVHVSNTHKRRKRTIRKKL